MRTLECFALLSFALLPGTAWADYFVINATTNPMTGTYIPVGVGHYNNCAGCGAGFGSGPLDPFGLELGEWDAGQSIVPEDPSSPSPCLTQIGIPTGTCLNYVTRLLAIDGTSLMGGGCVPCGVDIYNPNGDLLAFMTASDFGDQASQVDIYVSLDRGPIDVGAQPSWFQTDVASAPKIVYTGGIQDVIHVEWYDGNVDSYELILSTPEPTSVLSLGTIAFGGVITMVRRKRTQHST